MTEAQKLLSSMTTSYLVNPAREPHIVIDTKRVVHVPKELQRIAVQYDHSIETVTFDCPRYWDGIDMSEMYIYVNFMRQDRVKGRYLCKNVQVDSVNENIMHFTWTLEQDATLVKGKLRFLVCIMKTGEDGVLVNHWNSELNDECTVSEGMECQELPEDFYPEIITDLLTRMDNILLATDPLVLDKSLKEPGLAAEAKATGDRFVEVEKHFTDVEERFGHYENYVTPQMFGAKADGSTDDTNAIQQALDSLTNGGILFFPAGVYRHGTVNINSKSNVIIDGNYAKHVLVGTGSGFNFTGSNSHVTITRCVIQGDGSFGDVGSKHIGIGSPSGASLEHIKIIDNTITNVTIGISVNADLDGHIYDVLVKDNFVDTCVGTDTGYGYGIHVADGANEAAFVRVINNTIRYCERHSIYIARGRMYQVEGNSIWRHRWSVNNGEVRAAINIARSSDVNVCNNILAECHDGHVCITAEENAVGYPLSSYPAHNINVTNNIFRGNQSVSAVWIGYLDASAGIPSNITVEGNHFHDLNSGISLMYGINVKISNNMFRMTSGTGININATDGCDNYNITDNMFHYAGSGTPIRLNPTFCDSTVNAFFGNVMTNSNAAYNCAMNVLNPNVSAVGNTSGLYSDVRLKQFTVNQSNTIEKEYGRTSINLFSGTAAGEVNITFDKPFSAVPTIIVTPQNVNAGSDQDTYRDIQMRGVGYIVSACSVTGFTLKAVKEEAYTDENTVAAFTWTAFNC